MSEHLSHTASVLVVDDNVWMQRVLGKTLMSFSITPIIASNAYDAIGFAVNNPPHAIIIDVVMPEIDGLQTLRLLKSINITRKIPVFVITASGDADSMGIALRLGADGFIRKPFTRASLLEKLQSVLPDLELIKNDQSISEVDFTREVGGYVSDPPFDALPVKPDGRLSPAPHHKDTPVRMSDSSLVRPNGRPSLPRSFPGSLPPSVPPRSWDIE